MFHHSGGQEGDACFLHKLVIGGQAFCQDEHAGLSCGKLTNLHSVLGQLLKYSLHQGWFVVSQPFSKKDEGLL